MLADCWRLWYAALFQPARLAALVELPFMRVALITSLPLVIAVLVAGSARYWWLWPVALLCAFCLRGLGLPGLALHTPLLAALVISTLPARWVQGLAELPWRMPAFEWGALALTLCAGTLALTIALAERLARWGLRWLAYPLSACGGSLAALLLVAASGQGIGTITITVMVLLLALIPVAIGWIDVVALGASLLACLIAGGFVAGAMDHQLLVVLGGLVGLTISQIMIAFVRDLLTHYAWNRPGGDTRSAMQFEQVLARATIGTLGVLSALGGLGGGLVLAGIAELPLPAFLIACWLIGWSIAPVQSENGGIVILLALVVSVGLQAHGGGTALGLVLIVLGYARLLPDALIQSVVSLLGMHALHARGVSPAGWLRRLPPYTSEIHRLPLPGHARLLRHAFHTDAPLALETVALMQASPSSGGHWTLRRALPLVIVDQLASVATVDELLLIVTPDHPLLPVVAHALAAASQPSTPEVPSRASVLFWRSSAPPHELTVLLPELSRIAQEVARVLAEEAFERRAAALAECAARFDRLPERLLAQAPARVVTRWLPVIAGWRAVVAGIR
jgi:hypothetical protein